MKTTRTGPLESGRKALSTSYPWLVLSVWCVAVSLPIAYMMAGHMVSLPIARSAIELPDSAVRPSEWRITHVLSDQCLCSRNVIEYLSARNPSDGIEEWVALLDSGSETANELRALGFQVIEANGEAFRADYGSEGVPYFQIKDSEGSLRFSGGYAPSGSIGQLSDLDTLERMRRGASVEEMPVIGCATSERLKSALDPFSFKY